ncbi:transcriptional regulator [Thiothrix subterranea]|uniref:ATP-binding protein n=1 Tax=Thiothrix subterranea TaxID=2735563 RepID=UPI00192C22DC|nr:ATP-binding protein [Thiothrix subterranea]QQZ29820.1 transcriptional regulator [Thiothrix subterranea]
MPQHQLTLFEEFSYFEGADVEYKSAKGGLPSTLWETYSGFANTGGGTLYLGITQTDADSLDIHGLPIAAAEKLRTDFWNTLNNRGKVSINLLSNGDVSLIPLPDASKVVIRIHVPPASRTQKPVYIGQNPLFGTYRRYHEGDYRCSEDEVRRMFADQSSEPADSRILQHFGWNDLDKDSIRQFRNRFASRDPYHAWLEEDDLGLLTKLGGWRRDRASGQEGLTLAGLLMFGKHEAITDPAAIPGFHVDYRERVLDDPAMRWSDRVYPDGKWEANLFQFYQRIILKLSTNPNLKNPFRRDKEGYRQAGTEVHEALQEALVNAIIHADYAGMGGIVVECYPDRFEFANPGSLLVSREQLLLGGTSECRNKALQKMFQMLGAGDKAGSGLDKIRRGWATRQWQAPALRETLRPDRVYLILSMLSILSTETLEQLALQFGETFRQLNQEEVQTLVITAQEEQISNQRLQEMLPLHRVDITQMLRGLVQKGMLIVSGTGRGTRYRLPPNEQISNDNDTSSPVNETTPVTNETTPVLNETTLPTILSAIAEPARQNKRLSASDMRNIILQLCAYGFLPMHQLADLLKRDARNLRNRYVSQMVSEGLLELRHPENLNHHDQAYRRKSMDAL